MPRESRVAIVTGGGRGLGRAMVIGLLEHGVSVVAVDRDRAPLDELAGAWDAGKLAILAQDLTAPDADANVRETALRAFGRIDVLVNNAGMGQSVVWPDHWVNPLRVWQVEVEQWKRFFELNTHVVFRMANMAIPLMLEQGFGRIVNVTTSLGSMLRAGFGPYGASKAATESLSRITAEELKGSGITVNVLTPGGLTNTAANPGAPFDRARMIQPQVMVPPLLWLISDAASQVTGRRFLASHWNPSIPPEQAAEEAGAPAAWDPGKSLPKEPERTV